MRSLLIVIKEEYLSKGIAVGLMDSFQSIHTTRNAYEAIEVLKNNRIDTVITEIEFKTIDANEYIERITGELKTGSNLIIIKDSSLTLEDLRSHPNIIIHQKPISIKKIIRVIDSLKTKEEEN